VFSVIDEVKKQSNRDEVVYLELNATPAFEALGTHLTRIIEYVRAPNGW
jgi:hypothetical protein